MNVARIAGFPKRLLRRAADVADHAADVQLARYKDPPPPPATAADARGEKEKEKEKAAAVVVAMMGDKESRCLRALVDDPVVGEMPGAVGDDAWAGGFFALWQTAHNLHYGS